MTRLSLPRVPSPDVYLDGAGAAASCLCAIHCALMPSLAALLPLFDPGLLAEERT